MLSSTLFAFAFVLLEPLDRVRLQGRFQGRDACFAQRRGSAATSALKTAVRSQLCRVESPSCAGVADHQQLMRVQALYKKCLLPIVCRRQFYVMFRGMHFRAAPSISKRCIHKICKLISLISPYLSK